MWNWFINGEATCYRNRNLRGAQKDLMVLVEDWLALHGDKAVISSIELRWSDYEGTAGPPTI